MTGRLLSTKEDDKSRDAADDAKDAGSKAEPPPEGEARAVDGDGDAHKDEDADNHADKDEDNDEEKVAEAKAEPKKERPYRKAARQKVDFPAPKVTLLSRLARYTYWAVWFVLLPFVFACLLVWALTPPSGVELTGLFGWIQSFVREQPVPVGIGMLALAEMAISSVRRRLPLAKFAYPPLRPDVSEKMRSLFERAVQVLDEAEQILQHNEKAIIRELTAKERERLNDELDALRDAMRTVPFEEEPFIDALARADGEVDVRLSRWRKSETREYIESILVAVLVAFMLRTFVVEAFKIPSGSMIPTLQVGDHIFVNKFSYGPGIPYTKARIWTHMPPDRGDVMVFAYPEKPEQDFIKRVIALPGDKLEARGGHPIINGWDVPSCLVGTYGYEETESIMPHHEGDLFVEYLGDESYLTFYDRAGGGYPEYQGPFYVKGNEVYVMGDNRNNSHDSRVWFQGQGGGVPFENIKGRALFVWLSYSDAGIDWSRLGAPVMGRPRVPPSFKSLNAALDKCLRERPPIEKTTPPPATTIR